MEASRHLILDSIRSLHNIGSLFRTADGAGFEKLHLCEHTGLPPRKEISKTALGAQDFIPFQHWASTERCIRNLKKQGYTIIALEKTDASQDYRNIHYADHSQIALLLGHEVNGVLPHIQELCDYTIHLPMRGQKESLNVCQAAAIMMYKIME